MESLSKQGRLNINGKSLSRDMRNAVICDLVNGGASVGDLKFPRGLGANLAKKYKISKSTVSNIWRKYNENFSISPRKPMNTKDRKIGNEDREFIKALKNERPSIQLQTIRDEFQHIPTRLQALVFQQLAIQFEKICQ